MTARFTVYSPVLVMMPARMEGHCQPVCRNAVTKPAAAPASMASGSPKMGGRPQRRCRDGTAQCESAVGRHIGDVQHAEAQEQRHRNQRVDEAQLQCIQHGGNGKHRVTSSLKVMVQSIIQQCGADSISARGLRLRRHPGRI